MFSFIFYPCTLILLIVKEITTLSTIYIPVTALPLESVTGITDCVTGFPLASVIIN